jgi:hypothetical protein
MRIVAAIVAVAVSPAVWGQAGAEKGSLLANRNHGFLVKMNDSMNSKTSRKGDKITAVVIAPVPLRGGRVEGTVDLAEACLLRFSFNKLIFAGKTTSIESEVTGVVSSKGNAGQDDLGQRIRMEGGTLIGYGLSTAIEEGAEIRFVAWEK